MPPPTPRAPGAPAITAPNAVAQPDLSPLTPREIEVLKWIAVGKRNSEIGTILECSPRTAQKHVQNILAKLSVETRTAASAWWHERHQIGFGNRRS